jgi:hypothetical protein
MRKAQGSCLVRITRCFFLYARLHYRVKNPGDKNPCTVPDCLLFSREFDRARETPHSIRGMRSFTQCPSHKPDTSRSICCCGLDYFTLFTNITIKVVVRNRILYWSCRSHRDIQC